tara:strand:- start:3359 stop:3745 length:387 start_codon:yes stop_codon:yes gene_type:complete
MKIILKFIIIFLIFYPSGALYASDKIDRIDTLSKSLRCLICQGQSVYDSQSDFALSVKELINNKIEDGYSDEDIYNYLKTKYGDWIMYDPQLNKNTILLWLLPLILFIFGGLLIFRKAIIKLDKKNNV